MSISDVFSTFCSNLKISDDSLTKITDRYHSITKRINIDYWGSQSDTNHSLYVGSFGRDTEIFCSDIDMLVQLPYETYSRFNLYVGNGQSALLQEVKGILQKTYSTSHSKGDGQIIGINFNDGITFEILPAFLNKDGSYTFANSNNGGNWKVTDPKAEINAINDMNNKCNGNLKRLCKMARAWKNHNNVDISGILIDVLAYNFISNWSNKDKSYLYYDFMSRDFFEYLANRSTTQSYWTAMGSGRYVYNSSFQAKAKKAYSLVLEAINYENNGQSLLSKAKWREIYGTKFPS